MKYYEYASQNVEIQLRVCVCVYRLPHTRKHEDFYLILLQLHLLLFCEALLKLCAEHAAERLICNISLSQEHWNEQQKLQQMPRL